MTLDELKAEAKRQGYNLIKIQKKEKLLTCVCGCNRRSHFDYYKNGKWGYGLECKRCKKIVYGTTEAEVRSEWNKMVRMETKGGEHETINQGAVNHQPVSDPTDSLPTEQGVRGGAFEAVDDTDGEFA